MVEAWPPVTRLMTLAIELDPVKVADSPSKDIKTLKTMKKVSAGTAAKIFGNREIWPRQGLCAAHRPISYDIGIDRKGQNQAQNDLINTVLPTFIMINPHKFSFSLFFLGLI